MRPCSSSHHAPRLVLATDPRSLPERRRSRRDWLLPYDPAALRAAWVEPRPQIGPLSGEMAPDDCARQGESPGPIEFLYPTPPLTRPLAGAVIGFALRWPAQEHGVLWVSGDTVLYRGVRKVAARLKVDTALLHLGGVQFPVTGPLRYTMTAREAVKLCEIVRPRTVIPIHYEGWSHFRQGRKAIERRFANAAEDIRRSIRWVPIGLGVELEG